MNEYKQFDNLITTTTPKSLAGGASGPISKLGSTPEPTTLSDLFDLERREQMREPNGLGEFFTPPNFGVAPVDSVNAYQVMPDFESVSSTATVTPVAPEAKKAQPVFNIKFEIKINNNINFNLPLKELIIAIFHLFKY